MSKQVKKSQQNNLKLIRKFDEDILVKTPFLKRKSSVLNYIFESHQNNYKYRKLLRRRRLFWKKRRVKFTYRVFTGEKEFKRKKRTLKKSNYLNLLKLRTFYGNLGKRKFKKLFKKRGVDSNFLGRSFAYFVESRLDVILYRANFFSSVIAAKQYINHGKVYVNGVLVKKPSFKVSVNDIITLKNFESFYIDLKDRLKNKSLLVNYPKYLEVNYKLASIILIKLPALEEVPFPFFMDLKKVAHKFLQ